ncbi:NAD(P)H-binding protein [Nocardia callitridis]|uniref:NAD(P)H-binding protein n=1 Tax=Nocardia callitridis TaxID=648753 RepID=A0ABP9L3P2_9NOCA
MLGATGTTGGRVVEFLRGRSVPVRLATRTPGPDPRTVRFDWWDRASYSPALRGVRAVYLVAPIGVEQPVPIVELFLKVAAREGVRRVVLLGSSAVDAASTGTGALYELVRATMPEWAVLRPSWFMQNFLGDHVVAHGVRTGAIATATGEGRVAFIDPADIAAVAGHALVDETPHNTEHLLTGPEALSYADTAAILSAHLGRPIVHRAISTAEAVARYQDSGIPVEFAKLLAELDEDIRAGTEDRVTDTVRAVTGRIPRSFREFVRVHL